MKINQIRAWWNAILCWKGFVSPLRNVLGLAPCVLCAVNCAPDLTTWSKGSGWSEQHKYSQGILVRSFYDFCALDLKTWCKCVQGWWQHISEYSNTSLNRNRCFRWRLWIIIIILKLVQGQEGMNFSISAMHKLTCQHQLKRRRWQTFNLSERIYFILVALAMLDHMQILQF